MSQETIIALLLSIPAGILIALITPLIQDWLAKIYFPIRRKRIEAILEEYRYVASLRNNPNLFVGLLFLKLSLEIGFVFAAILLAMIFLTNPPHNSLWAQILSWAEIILITFLQYAIYSTVKSIRKYHRAVNYFEDYRQKVHLRVEKLGGKIQILEDNQTAYRMEVDPRK